MWERTIENIKFCSSCAVAVVTLSSIIPTLDPKKDQFAEITEGFDFVKTRFGVDEEGLKISMNHSFPYNSKDYAIATEVRTRELL